LSIFTACAARTQSPSTIVNRKPRSTATTYSGARARNTNGVENGTAIPAKSQGKQDRDRVPAKHKAQINCQAL
jgi:esterase/lipase superfamily enzyme